MKRSQTLSLLIGIWSACLTSCIFEESSEPRGSEVENELTVGRIYLADGKPAAGARVKIYSVDYLPGPELAKGAAESGPVFSAFANEKGEYVVGAMARGQYNILASLDGTNAIIDSVFLSEDKVYLPPDTLKKPGAIYGQVALQPHHDPQSVTVQALGTESYVNVDREGRFLLTGLAEGNYRARVSTIEDQYTSLYFSFRVRAGRTDTLADTLKPPYIGIPVVLNLRAEYDTAQGVATIRWSAADYPQLSRYLIFRDWKGAPLAGTSALASAQDTVFHDTLLRAGMPVPGLSTRLVEVDGRQGLAFDLEYRVRIVNRSEQVGLPFNHASVSGATRSLVATEMKFKHIGGINGEVSVGDSITLEAAFHNPTRNQRSLRWYDERGTEITQWNDISGREGTARMTVAGNPEPADLFFRVEAEDETGRLWISRAHVRVVADRPVADAGEDIPAVPNSLVQLKGRGSDVFGSILKREWDIGGQGQFAEVSSGDTSFVLGDITEAGIPCILRVTDDDGMTGLDTVWIRFNHVSVVDTLSEAIVDGAAVSLDDRIFLIGGRVNGEVTNQVRVYDPETRTMTVRTPMPTPRRKASAALLGGKIYVTGGIDKDGVTRDIVEIYDPVANSWTAGAAMPNARHSHFTAPANGDLIVIGGQTGIASVNSIVYDAELRKRIEYYNPSQNIWHRSIGTSIDAFGRRNLYGTAFGAVGDSILMFVHAYNLADEVWVIQPGVAYKERMLFQNFMYLSGENTPTAVLDGNIYLFHSNGKIKSLKSSSLESVDYLNPYIGRISPMVAAAKGKVYIFGGWNQAELKAEPRVECLTPKQ